CAVFQSPSKPYRTAIQKAFASAPLVSPRCNELRDKIRRAVGKKIHLLHERGGHSCYRNIPAAGNVFMKWLVLKQRLDAYERLMRLDKSIGILLLLWPTLWALWLAGNGKPDIVTVLIFVTGT